MRRLLLTVVLVVAMAGPPVLAVFGPFEGGDRLWPLSWLAWAPVGFLILWRQPRNQVGRALLFIGFTMGLSFLTLPISILAASSKAGPWWGLIPAVAGVLPWVGIVWLLLVFPHGSLSGRAERIIAGTAIFYGALAAIAFALTPTPAEDNGLVSPLAVEGLRSLTDPLTSDSGFLPIVALAIGALALLVARWRRSSGPERAQFRWLLYGASWFLGILSLGQFLPDDTSGVLLWLPAGYAIPITIGVAVTRYRLFEIDRIVSRTVTYALLVGLLGTGFFSSIALFATFLPSDEPIVIAVATLLVAALFNPLRKRLQNAVDRRFNRSRYDRARIIDEFMVSLQDRPASEDVSLGLVGVVSQAMAPESTGLWVRE